MDAAETHRLIANLITTGTVVDIRYRPLRVRVQIGARPTDWLPCFQLAAGAVKIWAPPSIGEQVGVFAPSGEPTNGLVLRGLPSDALPSPSESPSAFIIAFPDGASITYDHATGALSATGLKTADIAGSSKATVDFPNIEFTGNVVIKGTLTVDRMFVYKGGMTGTGGERGTTAIQGDIIHRNGKLSSNGVVLDTHDHGDVKKGSDRSGPPQ